jgi:hypothetical protein
MISPASQLGKRSWEVRKSPAEIARLKRISKKGVRARAKKRRQLTKA